MKNFAQYIRERESQDFHELVPKLGSVIRQFKDLHWNVRGEGFLEIHELFGEVSENLTGFQDRIAEKARGMGREVTGQTSDIKFLRFEVEDSIEDAIDILTSLRSMVSMAEGNSSDITIKTILGELSEEIDAFVYKCGGSRRN